MNTQKPRYKVEPWHEPVASPSRGWDIIDTTVPDLMARVLGTCDTPNSAKRLAALLNSHAALIDALEAFVRQCDGAMLPGPIYISIDERDEARAALEAAKE